MSQPDRIVTGEVEYRNYEYWGGPGQYLLPNYGQYIGEDNLTEIIRGLYGKNVIITIEVIE